jgi:hypothetical protein
LVSPLVTHTWCSSPRVINSFLIARVRPSSSLAAPPFLLLYAISQELHKRRKPEEKPRKKNPGRKTPEEKKKFSGEEKGEEKKVKNEIPNSRGVLTVPKVKQSDDAVS